MKARSGSVLMEFLLVVPIYLALIGGTFAVGRLLLVSIKLAQADRVWAMSPEGEARGSARLSLSALLPLNIYEYDDEMYSAASDLLDCSDRTHRADESFQGAWSWLTAGRVQDRCQQPPWARAWLGFGQDFFENAVSADSERVVGVASDVRSFLANLVSVTAMETKRKYNYYTLKRTDVGKSSYRTWKPKNLTNVPIDFGALSVSDALPVWGTVWFRYVYMEPFPETEASVLDENAQEADERPDEPSWRTDYSRFPSYLLWSQ